MTILIEQEYWGRRRRSEAEKARIAAESLTPGAVVADIASRYGATRWQIYDWRRRFRRGLLSAPKEDVASPAFVPLSVDDDLQRTPHAEIVEVAIGDIELTRASVSTWRKRHEYDCLRAWTPLLLQKKTPP